MAVISSLHRGATLVLTLLLQAHYLVAPMRRLLRRRRRQQHRLQSLPRHISLTRRAHRRHRQLALL